MQTAALDELQWLKINDDWNLVAPSQRRWASYALGKTSDTFDADTGIFLCLQPYGG